MAGFEARYTAAVEEHKQAQIRAEVYSQRFSEKANSFIDRYNEAVTAIQNIPDETLRSRILLNAPAQVDVSRLEDIKYLREIKEALASMETALEQAGNEILG